jgi:D-alanyl-D-alanine dipeptidase
LFDIAPEIPQDMRYSSDRNFTGRPVPGYVSASCILAKPVAEALKRVQSRIVAENLSLLVLDCYRPTRAVSAFMRWAQTGSGTDAQREYHPRIARSQLVKRGYIAKVSSHSRGIAVDLTLIRQVPGDIANDQASRSPPTVCSATSTSKESAELDMGTSWDCFDKLSNTHHPDITSEAKSNRRLLTRVMAAEGFENYEKEWWHFSMPLDGFTKLHDFVVD